MNLKTIALALAVVAAGVTGGQAFAQDRDVTITRDTPNGVVTRHIERSDDGAGPVVRRTTRVVRPDGSTVVRRVTRRVYSNEYVQPQRMVVVHHRYDPEGQVVVRRYDEHPYREFNRAW
jgi:hypothetical protein